MHAVHDSPTSPAAVSTDHCLDEMKAASDRLTGVCAGICFVRVAYVDLLKRASTNTSSRDVDRRVVQPTDDAA
jgi:hypothetical protein